MTNALCRACTFALLSRDRHARACTFGTLPDQSRSWCRFARVSSEVRDVLVVGDLNPDLLVSGEDVVPRFGQQERYASMYMTLGGSAGIFAAGAARLGLRTALVACIGDDALGEVSVGELRGRGVDVSPVPRVAGARGRPSL